MQLAGFSLACCLERAFVRITHYKVPNKDRDASAKLSAYNQPL